MKFVADIIKCNWKIKKLIFLFMMIVSINVFYNMGKNIGEIIYYLTIK